MVVVCERMWRTESDVACVVPPSPLTSPPPSPPPSRPVPILPQARAERHIVAARKESGGGGGASGRGPGGLHNGSCRFNISLINFMEPAGRGDVALKQEQEFGLGTTSVSWHADSSLEPFSTIGVYQQLYENGSGKGGGGGGSNKKDRKRKGGGSSAAEEDAWRVAVRVTGDDVTPALAFPLVDRATYYMLGDFNHHHHHAVLTGSANRSVGERG